MSPAGQTHSPVKPFILIAYRHCSRIWCIRSMKERFLYQMYKINTLILLMPNFYMVISSI